MDPAGTRAAPVTVAIMGSCITRDNFNSRFNADYGQSWQCVLMQNQSSLLSLMSPPLALDEAQLGTASEYDRWNVVTDTSRQFLDELPALSPDYLILDFFGDVHFGALEVADGQYVTNNRWKLWPTPYYQGLKAAGPLRELRIETDTDDYLKLWREAFDRFVAHVRRVAPDTVVLVHRGRNTSTLRLPDSARTVPLQDAVKLRRIDVPRLNALWAELDDYATCSTGFAAIDLTHREYPTYAAHPWGPFWVHYEPDFYGDFLAALNQIHLSRFLDRPQSQPELAMLRQVVAHGPRRALAEVAARDAVLTRQEATVDKQRRRLDKLEASLAESVTRKVLRRLRRRVARRG